MSTPRPYPCLSVALVRSILAALEQPLRSDIVTKVRSHVADAIAIGIAARSTEMAQRVLQAQQSGSGAGTCPLIGAGQAAPLAAAFINSALIHIMDFDDIHDAGRLHPGTVVIPAVMAAAELADASDEAITQAIAMSAELMCKLGALNAPRGDGPGSDWFLTQLLGYIAAAIGAGLVLKLSEQQLISSIGLAYMQAAGGKEAGFGVGSTARSIYPAFAAQGGLQAALLAQAGIVGPHSALDGTASLFQIYFGRQMSRLKRKKLLDFSHWDFQDVALKPWPSCRLSHPYVAVALASRDVCQAHPQATVRVAVNASAGRLCQPLAQRRRPLTLQDAKYSIPFMTAFALVRGEPTLSKLTDDALRDTAVLDMALRVEVDETLPDKPGHPAALLTLRENSRTIHTEIFCPGNLHMDAARIRTKFEDCFKHAGAAKAAPAVWKSVEAGCLREGLRLSVQGALP